MSLIAQSKIGIDYFQKNSLYQQNFDGLPHSGTYSLVGKGPHALSAAPILASNSLGWQCMQVAGTSANCNFLIGTGSSTSQGTYSVGSLNSSERALGTLASGAGISSIGVIFTNSSDQLLNNITISFNAEQWRKGGSGNRNTWLCKYKTGSFEQNNAGDLDLLPSLNFSSVQYSTGAATLNGNLPLNQALIHQTLSITDWKPGEQLILRWDDADETGSDDLMAIDQFSFSADYIPPPPVKIEEITSEANRPTNADTIQYFIKMDGNVQGLSTDNFSLNTVGLTQAKIINIEGSGSDYSAKVFTGQGTGLIQIGIVNNLHLEPNISNLPFYSLDSQLIDKNGPIIKDVTIPNKSMKIGDTVIVNILIDAEQDTCKLLEGYIHDLPLKNFSKKNDSTYTGFFTVPSNGKDISAAEDIAVKIILTDSLNNKSLIYNKFIQQNNDGIDANKPIQLAFYSNNDTLLHAGDSLKLVLRFNEPVNIDINSPTDYLPVTIGNKIKNITNITRKPSDSLVFAYIIQPNENDKDGIKISSSFATKNLIIKDARGNAASISIQSNMIQLIKVDAIVPEFNNPKDTTIILCESNTIYLLDTLLKVNNKEVNERLIWTLEKAPTTIIIDKIIDEQKSTTSTILPQNVYFKNPLSYFGKDSCIFKISDGINASFKKIYFSITSEILDNNISNDTQHICALSNPTIIIGSEKSSQDYSASFLWEMSTSSDSSGFIIATGIKQEKDYQPTALSKSTWFRRKMQNGACINVSNSTLIKVWNNNLWTGKTNNDWNVKENWCGNKTPSDTNEVYVPINHVNAPVINERASARIITLSKTTSLTIKGALSVFDKIIADKAAIDAVSGSVIFNGNSKQTIDAALFKNSTIGNVEINNSEGVSLNNSTIIAQSLTLNKGFLQTNDLLTFKDNAVVGASAMGTQLIGLVNVEHRFTHQPNSNFLSGHPFSDSIPIIQVGNMPLAFYNNPISNYDSCSINNNWKAFNNGILLTKNYWHRFEGIQFNKNNFNDTPTLHLSGTLNTGLQEITLLKNEYAGFNVISNPFLSPINLSACSNGKMVGKYYWIWNPMQGNSGGFTAIPTSQPHIIHPFQAFVAESRNYSDNVILIPEESKTTEWNNNPDSVGLFKEEDGFFVELSLYSDNIFWDRLVLIDKAGARNSKDSIDGTKLYNPEVNFYSVSTDQQKLSVDARKLDNSAVIPINLESKVNRKYYFKVNQAFLPNDNLLVLHDRYTNNYLPLQQDSIYSFLLDSSSRVREALLRRFEISKLYPKKDTIDISNQLTIKIFPNPVGNELMVGIRTNKPSSSQIHIYSVAGILLKSYHTEIIESANLKILVNDLTKGSYILRVSNGNQQKTLRFIKL